MRAQITNRDYENLSAYLDGQLAPGERRKLEERLRTQPELQKALDELGRTRMLLRNAPKRRAPRNFTLTPAMVGSTRQAPRARWFDNLFPALSFTSALATLALVASLFFDLLPFSRPVMTNAPAMPDGLVTESQQDAARKAEEPGIMAAPEEQAAPEEPAAAESAGPEMEAAQAMPTATPGLMATPAPEMAGDAAGSMEAQPEAKAAAPPAVAWDGVLQPQMGGIGGAYARPPSAWGMGGGGDGMYGMGGGGTSQFVVPLEAAEGLPEAGAQRESVVTSDHPSGGGPILGLPAAEDAGAIQSRSAWGAPLESTGAEPAGSPESVTTAERPRELLGLPALRFLQILLLTLAAVTGIGAFLLWRRKAG